VFEPEHGRRGPGEEPRACGAVSLSKGDRRGDRRPESDPNRSRERGQSPVARRQLEGVDSRRLCCAELQSSPLRGWRRPPGGGRSNDRIVRVPRRTGEAVRSSENGDDISAAAGIAAAAKGVLLLLDAVVGRVHGRSRVSAAASSASACRGGGRPVVGAPRRRAVSVGSRSRSSAVTVGRGSRRRHRRLLDPSRTSRPLAPANADTGRGSGPPRTLRRPQTERAA
jgi:hypothetical protein